jgi:nucleoside-diphosphate-sugar epimerase
VLEHLNAAPARPARVVIVGAGGFVGSTVRKQLERERIPLLALTRKELNLLQDGADKKLASMLQPADSVLMVSAITPAKTNAVLMENLTMMAAACAALVARDVAHIVHISSDAVYADDQNPVTERSYCAPSTLHGIMHAARELMVKGAVRAPLGILRPTLIYGAADPHGGYGPNRFRRQADGGQPIEIFGDGEEMRDHVLVDDVASLALLMLTHRSRGALNAVTGVSTSFHDIAHSVAKLHGGTVRSVPRPAPRPHLLHRFFDITNCHKAFPNFRFTPLAEGLARAHRESRRAS